MITHVFDNYDRLQLPVESRENIREQTGFFPRVSIRLASKISRNPIWHESDLAVFR